MTNLNDNMPSFKRLTNLDLLNFTAINSSTLSRLINGSHKFLKSFKLSYACLGLDHQSMLSLTKCKNLKEL